jgi:putative hemolysin
MENIWLELVLIGMGILANGLFAGSEIALVSARVSRLTQLRQQAVPGAATALSLKQAPESFLATIQVAITSVGTLASAVGGATAIEAITPWLATLPLSGARLWAEPVALGLVILLITYVSLVLGELVPKAIALRDPERLACLVARPIQRLSRATGILVRVLTVSTTAVLRAIGIRAGDTSLFVSEDEVRYLVSEGAAKGIFEKVEEELVHNVFEFADTTVREVMVVRPNILGLDLATPPDEVVRRAAEIGHSHVPVYRDSIENPVGVVTLKDLLRAAALGTSRPLDALMRPVLFIPEFARISVLLREFQRSRQNMAIVVDEYGGVVGLVTVEDVLEEIVGEIREEHESAALPYVTRLPDGSYVLDGTAPVRDLRSRLGLPLEESPDYSTVAGFVLHSLQSIPTPGASIAAGGHRWTVVDVEGPRITKVKVHREA